MHHSKAESLAAYERMPRPDLGRLRAYARWRMAPLRGRLHHSDPEDLFSEALVRTFDGTRRWRIGISFTQHLLGCMSSIANSWFDEAVRHTELCDVPVPSPALDLEMDIEKKIQRLRDLLEGNAVALTVLDSVLKGQDPAEAITALGIRSQDYWAARKQIRRRGDLLLKEEGPANEEQLPNIELPFSNEDLVPEEGEADE